MDDKIHEARLNLIKREIPNIIGTTHIKVQEKRTKKNTLYIINALNTLYHIRKTFVYYFDHAQLHVYHYPMINKRPERVFKDITVMNLLEYYLKVMS